MSSGDHGVVLLVNGFGEAERTMDERLGRAHVVHVHPTHAQARAQLHIMMQGNMAAFASCGDPDAVYTGTWHSQQTVFFDEVEASVLAEMDTMVPILLAAAVSVPPKSAPEKRFALFVWQMHPENADHPQVTCVFVSTDEAAVLARFVQTVEAQSQIPWDDWRVFDDYCCDASDSPAWKARGESFEVDERYWLKDWGFMMTGIDPLLADAEFQGWQGCCIAELHE